MVQGSWDAFLWKAGEESSNGGRYEREISLAVRLITNLRRARLTGTTADMPVPPPFDGSPSLARFLSSEPTSDCAAVLFFCRLSVCFVLFVFGVFTPGAGGDLNSLLTTECRFKWCAGLCELASGANVELVRLWWAPMGVVESEM